MTNFPAKLIFFFTLMMGTLISISSNSWLGAWMGLEINLLSFIPLMTNSSNSMATEASLKYFLIQAAASASLLFSIIIMHLMTSMMEIIPNSLMMILISSTLLLKMGAAPFHFWFPGTMEGLNWINCLILMTWQKIAPLMLLSYTIIMNSFLTFVIIASILIGSLGGLNQTSLRKLLAYSSINHLGWMLAAMYVGENMWMFYFLIYSFLSSSIIFIFSSFQIYHINQIYSSNQLNVVMKFCTFSLFLSLGGLPPFLGFLPKWLIIESLAYTNSLFIITIMVITTLMTLFYYIRITFSAFLFSYPQLKWMNWNITMNFSYLILLVLTTISSLGLLFCTLISNIF